MSLRILVNLPPHPQRQNAGLLRLVDHAGAELLRCDCLGKADNQTAMAAGNPARDPVEPDGDTPTGLYAAAKLLPIAAGEPAHAHMGDWFLPLIGVSGDAARAKANGRKGLAIHAGRPRKPDGHLVPTNGCLRISTEDMTTLHDLLQGRAVDEIAVDEKLAGA